VTDATAVAGDPIPANSEVIEVRIAELQRLFNAIDPSALPMRDLDPKIEQFIVDWGAEAHGDRSLALLVIVDGPAVPSDEAARTGETVRRFFALRANATRRRLRRLFQVGRVSLLIGLVVLAAFTGVGQLIASRLRSGLGEVVRESLSIAGWVAMWRPLEVFLYDWWPIRAEARLYDRLAVMPVRVRFAPGSTPV